MLARFNGVLERLRNVVTTHLSKPNVDPSVTDLEIGVAQSRLVRRVDPNASEYVGTALKADWWLRWEYANARDLYFGDAQEVRVATDPQLRELALRRHRIEYDPANYHGYFPLWEPQRRRNGSPVRNTAGRIARVQRVIATADMVAAWTWYYPLDPRAQNHTRALRPNEV